MQNDFPRSSIASLPLRKRRSRSPSPLLASLLADRPLTVLALLAVLVLFVCAIQHAPSGADPRASAATRAPCNASLSAGVRQAAEPVARRD